MEASHMFGLYHRDQAVANEENHNNKMMDIMLIGNHHINDHYDDDDETDTSESSISSSFADSNVSKESSSSELLDDASSSSSSSSPPQQSNGPLYEFSELMDQLPIKRGLSKFYQGKSQSFTSLAKVASLEDLAKKETPYQRKLKACRSYGGGLNNFRSYTLPKSTISKKVSKGSLSNLSCLGRKNSFMGTCRPPLNNVQSSF